MVVDRCAAKQNDGASVNVRMSASLRFNNMLPGPKVDIVAASQKAAQSSLC
jgi:hypothetical protein